MRVTTICYTKKQWPYNRPRPGTIYLLLAPSNEHRRTGQRIHLFGIHTTDSFTFSAVWKTGHEVTTSGVRWRDNLVFCDILSRSAIPKPTKNGLHLDHIISPSLYSLTYLYNPSFSCLPFDHIPLCPVDGAKLKISTAATRRASAGPLLSVVEVGWRLALGKEE